MTTLSPAFAPLPPASPSRDEEQHFVVHQASWANYLALGQIFADRPGLRMTFDRGTLEFMTTSTRHERYKRWLARFIETIAEEWGLPIMPGGSMTFQREDLDRGFEPDDCFWIAHELAVRDKLTWEPHDDPPPDVALEIEVPRSALNRMVIFAAFRIPEVWCYDGTEMRIYHLQTDGSYHLHEQSLAFLTVRVKDLARFFPPIGNAEYLSEVAAVRAWVRSQMNHPS